MKAIVLCFEGATEGGAANEIVLKARVAFTGLTGGAVDVDTGDDGTGMPITVNITQLNQYPNNVEDALIARASALGHGVLARTDCLFPTYQRGA